MSRNVLSPTTQRMSNNRNYRVNMVHDDFGGSSKWNAANEKVSKGYEEPGNKMNYSALSVNDHFSWGNKFRLTNIVSHDQQKL